MLGIFKPGPGPSDRAAKLWRMRIPYTYEESLQPFEM